MNTHNSWSHGLYLVCLIFEFKTAAAKQISCFESRGRVVHRDTVISHVSEALFVIKPQMFCSEKCFVCLFVRERRRTTTGE